MESPFKSVHFRWRISCRRKPVEAANAIRRRILGSLETFGSLRTSSRDSRTTSRGVARSIRTLKGSIGLYIGPFVVFSFVEGLMNGVREAGRQTGVAFATKPKPLPTPVRIEKPFWGYYVASLFELLMCFALWAAAAWAVHWLLS